METMIGTIMAVGFDYAPNGWAICNGQTLTIQGNTALFSILGTVYGGDGRTTFGLPDLRGRTIVGAQGTPPSVTPVALGAKPGVQSVTTTGTGTRSVPIAVANLPVAVGGPVQINGLQATSTLYATSAGPGPTTPTPGSTAPSTGAMLSGTGPSGASSGAIYYTNPTPSVPLQTVALNAASVKTAIGGTASFTGQLGTAAPTPLSVALTTSTTTPVMQPSLGLTYLICISGYYPSRN